MGFGNQTKRALNIRNTEIFVDDGQNHGWTCRPTASNWIWKFLSSMPLVQHRNGMEWIHTQNTVIAHSRYSEDFRGVCAPPEIENSKPPWWIAPSRCCVRPSASRFSICPRLDSRKKRKRLRHRLDASTDRPTIQRHSDGSLFFFSYDARYATLPLIYSKPKPMSFHSQTSAQRQKAFTAERLSFLVAWSGWMNGTELKFQVHNTLLICESNRKAFHLNYWLIAELKENNNDRGGRARAPSPALMLRAGGILFVCTK